MFNNCDIAIVDVGSDMIYIKIGEIAKDNVFHIKSSAEMYYDGFMEGDWLNGDDVSKAVRCCLDKALYNFSTKLSAIYVGVPGDFARVQTRSNKLSFGCNHKINIGDINAIKEDLYPSNDGRFEVVSTHEVSYRLDGKYETLAPLNKSCFMLEVRLSFAMCKKSFCDLFKTILSDYSRKIKFVDLSTAQCLMATDKDLRIKNSAVLVDIGYLTTDIAYIKGDGLIALNTLPIGGGHIAYDLSYGLDMQYNDALSLKSTIDFNGENTLVKIGTNNGIVEEEKSYISMIASSRLEEIAEEISKIIANYPIKYEKFLKIYLTGRGIADMKGVRSVMANALGRQCELIRAMYEDRNKIYLSQASIIQYVCQKDKPSKPSLINKLFGWLSFYGKIVWLFE